MMVITHYCWPYDSMKKKYPANFFFLCRKAMILLQTVRVLFHQSLQFKVFLISKLVPNIIRKKHLKRVDFSVNDLSFCVIS